MRIRKGGGGPPLHPTFRRAFLEPIHAWAVVLHGLAGLLGASVWCAVLWRLHLPVLGILAIPSAVIGLAALAPVARALKLLSAIRTYPRTYLHERIHATAAALRFTPLQERIACVIGQAFYATTMLRHVRGLVENPDLVGQTWPYRIQDWETGAALCCEMASHDRNFLRDSMQVVETVIEGRNHLTVVRAREMKRRAPKG